MNGDYELRKIWDPLIRAWHWLLVVVVTTGWLLGEYRDFDTIEYHMYCGYVVGGLVVARLYWGFAGPPPARFNGLVVSPASLFGYLRHIFRREPSGVAGHNPIGALSVILMLVSLTTQVLTGLFADDDGLFAEGPLVGMVPSGLRGVLDEIHHINSRVLLILVCLHVAAILFYLVWKRENLVKPMLTGWKMVRKDGKDH